MSTSGGAVGVVPLPVGIAAGGTGAITAPAALAALGAQAAATSVKLALSTDGAIADAPTVIPCNNVATPAPCLIAAPPAWMDNAGNIITAGLYAISVGLVVTTPPTVPQLYVAVTPVLGLTVVPLDGISYAGAVNPADVIMLSAAFLPFPVAPTVQAQTDVTGVLSAQAFVRRLAYV